MEYADTINSATFAAAVSLTRELQAERGEPVATSAAEAVSRTFCACVTDGEDAAERRFSDIHRQLIEEVIARATFAETQSPEERPHARPRIDRYASFPAKAHGAFEVG